MALLPGSPPPSSPARPGGEERPRGLGLGLGLDLDLPPTPPEEEGSPDLAAQEEDPKGRPRGKKAKRRRSPAPPGGVRSFRCRFNCLFAGSTAQETRVHEEEKHCAERKEGTTAKKGVAFITPVPWEGRGGFFFSLSFFFLVVGEKKGRGRRVRKIHF